MYISVYIYVCICTYIYIYIYIHIYIYIQSLEEIQQCKVENSRLELQILEMVDFLKDYGLDWIGIYVCVYIYIHVYVYMV
jgi:hypothetical protein